MTRLPRGLIITLQAFAATTLTASPALAQTHAQLPPGTVAYYAAMAAVLALLALVTAGVGEYRWFGYTAAVLAMLIWNLFNEQKLMGIVWIGYDPPDRLLVFGGQCLPVLFMLVGAATFPPGPGYRRRRAFVIGAAIFAALAASGLILPTAVALATYNVSIIVALGLQIVPLWTLPRLPGERRWPATIAGGAIFVVLAAAFAWMLLTGRPSAVGLLDLNRAGLAILVGFGGLLALRRIVAIREDRARALQRALAEAEKEAETSRSLLEAERRYRDVEEVVRRQRLRFAEASHDIRQPIASLRAHVAALADSQSPELREQLQKAFDYLEHLAESYDVEPATAPETPREAVPVPLLIETLDRMFRAAVEAKGLTFTATATDTLVAGDALGLMRILSNLLANAVDHTDRGEVALRAHVDGDRVAFEVFSTGKPIDDADLERIFERSEKGSASAGQGLGLAIVRRVADAAGLPVEVRAEPGKGNSFAFTAPLAVASAPSDDG